MHYRKLVEQGGGRLDRRSALQLLIGGGGLALLAACAQPGPQTSPTAAPAPSTPAPQSTPVPTSAPTATPAPVSASTAGVTTSVPAATEQVRTGGTLRTGMVGDIITLDGIAWTPTNSNTVGQAYDELITYDDQLTPHPRLAESWELSTDATQIKLNLRHGVQFHSGREFTSDDVRYNLLRARDPTNPFAAVVAVGSAWWTGIDTPDKYTVILTSDMPRPGVFDFLLYLRILDKDTMEGPDASTKVNGTGPYQWGEWVQGDHILITRNPNYWQSGHPYLDQVHVSVFRDQQSMVAALEAGAIDVADLSPIPDALRLQSDPTYKIYDRHDIGQFFYVTANATVPPTDNKLVRQAINYAIDRKRFTDTILRGMGGDPQDLPWAPISPASEDSKNRVYTYDLDKAKSLLQGIDLSGAQLDISYALAGFSAEYASLASILQSDLSQIGINTNLKPMESAAFTAAGNGTQPTYNGLRLSAGAFANLSEASSEFTLSRTFGYKSNLAGFYDDQFTALVTAAATEPDVAQRKPLYSQINDILLDSSYSMVISQYPNIMITRANVNGLQYATSLEWTLRDTWLG